METWTVTCGGATGHSANAPSVKVYSEILDFSAFTITTNDIVEVIELPANSLVQSVLSLRSDCKFLIIFFNSLVWFFNCKLQFVLSSYSACKLSNVASSCWILEFSASICLFCSRKRFPVVGKKAKFFIWGWYLSFFEQIATK